MTDKAGPKITTVYQKPVPGVIEVLGWALEEANAGRIRNVAIVAEASSDNSSLTMWGLENNMVLVGLLERVKHRILAGMD
jgi:hypothetical protein